MKQSRFSLADVLAALTAVGFGFICFLGKNFNTLGNTSESMMWGLFIAILLAGFVLAAKQLKRTSRNFKALFILEISVLVLFTIFMVFVSYFVFPAFFNVSANKTQIQNKLQMSIAQAENMFPAYELYAENRKSFYKGQLEGVSGTREIGNQDRIKFGLKNDIPDDPQIRHKMFTIQAVLYPTNYSDTADNNGIKEVAKNWLSKATTTTKNWKPISIVNVVKDIENNSKGWLSQLIGLSKSRVKGENYTDFNYNLTFSDVKTHFTTLGRPTLLSIGLAALAYMLMLLSWFITKRHTRRMPKKADYEVVL